MTSSFEYNDESRTPRGEILQTKRLSEKAAFKFLLICLIFVWSVHTSSANDTIPVLVSGRTFETGDTLSFDFPGNFKESINVPHTVHLWIDHIQSKSRWKFRYPIMNGTGGGDIVLSKQLPDGYYALNFLFDRRFFELNANIRDYKSGRKSNVLLVDVINKFDITTMEIQPAQGGNFSMPPILFPDTSTLVFAYDKNKYEDIYIDLETPLDSLFIPFHSYTTFIRIGNDPVMDTLSYKFEKYPFDSVEMLPEVIVTGKVKSNIELFEKEFTSGLFKTDFCIRIDGLTNDELSRYPSILQIIQARIPGLAVRQDSLGTYNVKWRRENVSFYLDEFRLPVLDLFINPADIALIKAFPPPAYIRPLDEGGVIAIYTKRGKYEKVNDRRKSIFKVAGYTPAISVWE